MTLGFEERLALRRLVSQEKARKTGVVLAVPVFDARGVEIRTHSRAGYVRGCRCNVCRDGHARYMRKRTLQPCVNGCGQLVHHRSDRTNRCRACYFASREAA